MNYVPDSHGSIASKLTSPAPPTMNSSLSPSKSTKGGGGLFDAEKGNFILLLFDDIKTKG